MISSIIPIRNEQKYIESCLDSIINQDFEEENEIIVVDGCSTDRTPEILIKYQENYKNVRLFINDNIRTSYGLNIGIKHSNGDIIIRFDAHAFYPKDYMKKCVNWLRKLDADNVGGIIKTQVKTLNKKTSSITAVLSDIIGVGNSKFRVGINKPQKVDTVPFGCFKKETFIKYGLFNVELNRNQDIEFNSRINKSGGRIYLIPDIYSIYYARETFLELLKNSYLNGLWNVKTIVLTKNIFVFGLRHFAPLGLILCIFWVLFFHLSIIPIILLSCYIILIISRSLFLKEKNNSIFYIILTFIVLHISYGLGIMLSPLSLLKFK
jgi:glycosyltransferase involved in cell wall biosynthesis